MNATERRHLIELIDNCARERGNPMLHSVVGTFLQLDSVASSIRQQYTQLSTLIGELAPEIVQYQDMRGVNWVETTHLASSMPKSENAREGYPCVIEENDVFIDQDMQNMHAFAFMGWWSNTYKQLKLLTGYNGNDHTIWSKIIARQFAIARVTYGLKECTYTSDGSTQRICLFRTGLQTPDGSMIIAVLQANVNTDRQPWFFKEYTFAGNTEGEYGLWLLGNTDEAFLGQQTVDRKGHIRKMLDRMQTSYDTLKDDLQRLTDGCLLPLHRIDDVKDYLSEMATFMRGGPMDWIGIPDPMACTVTELAAAVRATGVSDAIVPLENALHALLDLMDEALTSISRQRTDDPAHPLARMRAFLTRAGQEIRSSNDARGQLEGYQQIAALLCKAARVFWLKEPGPRNEICDVFFLTPDIVDFFAYFHANRLDEVTRAQEGVTQVQSCLDEFRQSISAADAPLAVPAAPQANEDADEDLFADDDDDMPAISSNDFFMDEDDFVDGDDAAALQTVTETADIPDPEDDGIPDFSDDFSFPTAEDSEALPFPGFAPGLMEDADDYQDELAELYGDLMPPAAPAPAVHASAVPAESAEPERIELIRGMDEALQEQCANGMLEPNEDFILAGEWRLLPSGDPGECALPPEQLALLMLTDPSARTEENLAFCIQAALSSNNTALAETLLNGLPGGWRRALYSFILQMRRMAENTYPHERLRILSNNLPAALTELLKDTRGQTAAVQREVFLSVLAHVPMLFSRCFHPESITVLLKMLAAGENNILSDLGMQRTLRTLIGHLESIDSAYRYAMLSDHLQRMYNVHQRTRTLQNLRQHAEELTELFIHNSITYESSRIVVSGFTTEKLPRTRGMLDCLISGVPDPELLPFEDESEMRSYINAAQTHFHDAKKLKPISGVAMDKALQNLRRLNNAYLELLALDRTEDIPRALEQQLDRILKAILNWPLTLAHPISNHLPSGALSTYLTSLEYGAALTGYTALTYSYDRVDADCWPMWPEDLVTVALAEMAQVTPAFHALSLRMFNSTMDDDDLPELLKAIQSMQDDCRKYIRQLTDLIDFNTIDQEEYKALVETLSKTHGWLAHMKATLEGVAGDDDAFRSVLLHCLPLVRYEMSIWYADQRIRSIYQSVATSARELVISSADGDTPDAQLLADIDLAVEHRDIQTLSNRFMDSFDDVTRLRPRRDLAERFFSQRVQNALNALCNDKSEDWCRSIFTTPQDETLGLAPFDKPADLGDADPRKYLGYALRFARQFTTDPEDFSDKKLAEINAMFAYLGFGRPSVERQGEQFILTIATPNRSVCPLPQLGVGINRLKDNEMCVEYRLRFMTSFQDLLALLTAESYESSDTVTLLFCLFPLSFGERQQILDAMHDHPTLRKFLLLDKCFLRYVVCLPPADRLPAFYACASILLQLNPYSIDASTQWEKTFFGRTREINALMDMHGCHVLYGGRRLGKTSIMHEVGFRWTNNNNKKNLAVHIDLQQLGSYQRLWYEVAAKLRQHIHELNEFRHEGATIEAVDSDAQKITQIITRFLVAEDARLLLLLDECDKLIFEDTQLAYTEPTRTTRLKELLSLRNDTLKDRFKFILAGLQCATRFVHTIDAFTSIDPENDPRYQCLNDAICVRPLLGADAASAYDLVDVPFRMLGYKLEHRSILHILRLCCFRPNLIQNYCHELMETVQRSSECLPDSLYSPISHQTVLNVLSKSDFRDKHSNQSFKIPLNAGITTVYAPVAYAVALLSLHHSEKGRFVGFSAAEVQSLINSYEKDFTGGMSRALDYYSTILDELEKAGVLRKTITGGTERYALFSSYMLQMLGDSSSIEGTLVESIRNHMKVQAIDRDRTELFSQRRIIDNFVLPLTNSQLEQLHQALYSHMNAEEQDDSQGYAVIVGSDMLQLDHVPEMLRYIRLGDRPSTLHEMPAADLADEALREAFLAGASEGNHIVILQGAWPEGLQTLLEQLHVSHPDVRFLLLVSPETCMSQLDAMAAMPEKVVIHLTRLTPTFRIILFEAATEGRYNKADTLRITNLMGELTGDWPELVSRFLDLVRTPTEAVADLLHKASSGDADDLAAARAAFHSLLFHNDAAGEQLAAFGLDRIDPDYWQYLDTDNLAEGCETAAVYGLDADSFTRMVHYLHHLDLVDVVGSFSEPRTCIVTPERYISALFTGRCDE